jgi:hypothetical protein
MSGTTFQIRRSANVLAPTTAQLETFELGYSFDKANNGAGAALYIEVLDSGDNPVIHKIGGKYLTDIVDAATSQATPDTLVMRDGDGNFEGNVYGNANTASQLEVGQYINLFGDLTGTAYFDGSANADINVSVDFANVTVELGTNTNGDYVANVLAGTGIVVTGQGGETANVTVTLDDTAVSPDTYGGVDQIPVFTVDQQGRITGASNVELVTSFEILGDTGTTTFNLSNVLSFVGGLGVSTEVSQNTITITNTGIANVIGTENEIEIDYTDASNVVIQLPNHVITPGDLTVTGDLNVIGTTTSIESINSVLNDSLIKLANNNITSDVIDIGFYGEYYDGSDVRYAGLVRDASESGDFVLFQDILTDPTGNVVDYVHADLGTLHANFTGGNVFDLASAITVSDGGTGAQTFAANTVLLGNGTDPIQTAGGNDNEVLQIINGVPTFAMLDGGDY